jgi:hypothetical protein
VVSKGPCSVRNYCQRCRNERYDHDGPFTDRLKATIIDSAEGGVGYHPCLADDEEGASNVVPGIIPELN